MRDTGDGVPADVAGSVFDHGYTSRGAGAEGHGLGLSLARHTARATGGDIVLLDAGGPPRDVGGAAGHGAVFEARLCGVVSTAPDEGPPMIRVLVVEDDFRVARLHADLVAAVEGMEVAGVAHTAADALALAESERPDLVLLDEYLPDERGSALVGRLDAAVMLITAETDAAVLRRAVARGASTSSSNPSARAC